MEYQIFNRDPILALVHAGIELDLDAIRGLPYKSSLVGSRSMFASWLQSSHMRTSSTYLDHRAQYRDLALRLLSVVRTEFAHSYTINQCEVLQIARYGPGQFYRPHLDHDHRERRPRQATIMLYINSNFLGGQTEFCELGHRVQPHAGSVLYWRYQGSSGTKMLHQALPVIEGEKYIATLWVRGQSAEYTDALPSLRAGI